MRYPVFVRSESSTSFVAEPLGIPELKTVAATEREAIEQVEAALERWFASGKLVHVSVPSKRSTSSSEITISTAAQSGDVLLRAARSATDREFIVFSGHTHSPDDCQPLPNLHTLTGGATYGAPVVQAVFDVNAPVGSVLEAARRRR